MQDITKSFGGFPKEMLHLLWKTTKASNHTPSSHSLLGFSSLLAQKKFDKLRMTYKNKRSKNLCFFEKTLDKLIFLCYTLGVS